MPLTSNQHLKRDNFLSYSIFIFISILLLISRHLTFSSYNGTDDLHYAMLSSRLLAHDYHPFFAHDIYAGRILVIAWQALWFSIFGINDFSMQMPSLFALIFLAFIISFKAGVPRRPVLVAIACSLVYFNPVILNATLGNMPDIYIAVIACMVFIILKKNILLNTGNKILQGIAIGILLTAGLFIKETILFVYVATAITFLLFYKKINRPFLLSTVIAVIACGLDWLLLYHIKTGNAFFRFQQVQSSAYFNGCSYQCFSGFEMFKRLTVTVPVQFMEGGFFPLLLAFAILPFRKKFSAAVNYYWFSFIIITLTAIYFPLSINPYIPLCHEPRQFLFIAPIAVLLFINVLNELPLLLKRVSQTVFITVLFVLIISVIVNCLFVSFNKWIIMSEIVLCIIFATAIVSGKKYSMILLGFLMPAILWISTCYGIYKKQDHGYVELKQLHEKIINDSSSEKNVFYFTDNDTKMHFALLDKFNRKKDYVSLDTSGPGLQTFRHYQKEELFKDPGSFKPGWLIINPYYTTTDTSKLNAINNFLKVPPLRINKMRADFISSPVELQKLVSIINPKNIIWSGCNN